MVSPPAQEAVNFRCPICGHTFTQLCPTDHKGVILLEDDLCPVCGAQSEFEPPNPS